MENKTPYNYEARDLIPVGIGEYFRLRRLSDNPKSVPEETPLKTKLYHLYQGASIGLAVFGAIKGLEVLFQ